ncbi:efflux RND transporter periplasmic adaptor subunit [Aeoliella mucimassa]|uniref:efflux RND transporter periplasmic adaptor subunit n=1 Tax=Aeoliella mucimassa TaxID=2527972 RepID=UPI0018D47825|nr:HlyD family efflux transporter periplasmic adaptor subunit [Aeoliella mucimassa]
MFRTAASIALLAAGVGGCLMMGKVETHRGAEPEAPVPIVEVAVAQEQNDGIPFSVDGVVVPYRQVEIAAEVSGRVEYKADECRGGRTVRQGQLLLRIDSRNYQLEVNRLQQELTQAKGTLEELEVQVENAKTQIELAAEDLKIRQRELKRYAEVNDPGAVSGAEVDTARRNELSARNTLETQRDRLQELESTRTRLESVRDLVQVNLDKAQLDLKRCEIYAPIEGIVVSDEVEQDGYVQQGTPVVVLQDTSQVEVACKLYMSQMNWLWQSSNPADGDAEGVSAFDFPATPVEVVYDLGATSYVWDGVLQRYEAAGIDEQTRMAPCRVQVKNPLEARLEVDSQAVEDAPRRSLPTLMTGMFVEVRVRATPNTTLVRIPQQGLQPGNKVWVVRDGELVITNVRLAGRDGEGAVIYGAQGGPMPGDQVIVSPMAAPREGQRVEVHKDA